MMKIILVRHGVTEWNSIGKVQGSSDVKLSQEGIHQARLLAAHFPFQHVDAIYSSPLERAQTTATILANKFNVHVQLEPKFRETSFGDWEGMSLRDLAKVDPENFEKFFMQPEELKISNAETFQQTQERAMYAIQKIISKYKDEKNSHIIIVAHGAVNRTILCAFLEMSLNKMWAIAQFNTAVNILREDDGNWIVELLNGTAHLE